jgi:hypothetical protein
MGLFSTTHNHYTTKGGGASKVTIHEHKAPTDKSVELLSEMQEKAKDKIIATIPIEENFLKAVVIYYEDEFLMDRVHYHIKFVLNGKEYIIKDYIDKFQFFKENSQSFLGLNNEAVFKALYKKFVEVLAIGIINNNPESSQGLVDAIKSF